MKKVFILSSIILLIISCQKLELNNPFDPNCPKEMWTPTDFIAVQEGTTIKLSWSQPINQISGFKFTKKVDTGSATDMQSQAKGTTQFTDANLTGGKLHTYTIVAYAGNNQSNIVTATVTPILAAGGVTTTSPIVAAITAISATSGGTITSDGGSPITARGVCWGITTNPTTAGSKTTDGTGTGNFASLLTGLSPNTTYFVRAYATNAAGTTYGNEVSLKTLTGIITISTASITSITYNSAIYNGSISSDGGASVTARGVCWRTAHNPTITNSKTVNGTGTGSYTDSIKGLNNNITYYLRAYATNSIGTVYGNELSVILYMNIPDVNVSDIDGNVYKTVKIGNQVWMAENLKVTKYRNGNAVPNITDGTIWASLTTGAYCDFSNNVSLGATYGHLYNYYTVIDSRQLCPSGWHVPSNTELSTLLIYLGGGKVAGASLKEAGTVNWIDPNTSTNNSGFTARAGSWRGGDGFYYYWPRTVGYWWSSTSYNSTYSYFLVIASDNNVAVVSSDAYFSKPAGCSIRCIKD